MLRSDENEFVTRVGPGTPMGSLMRQYWVPAMLSSELPRPDCPPVRVMLLGEKLALRESGATPPGVDRPEAYRQRSGGVILDEGAGWVEATQDLRRAYVEHPGLDPAVTGGFV